jgi:hypothetical protein
MRAERLLPHQLAHGAVEAVERERVHAVAEQLADHAHRIRHVPLVFGDRVEPHAGRIGARHPRPLSTRS